ncbi:N,N-dimethylformamidase beta subunit family domain-containing protein, partial [Streptomyces odonnellii]|uniref:N,N-dimethylformamidase beta subunit family domain-containing protein n=1 Tax=Streptomyces odonnellii TaxID=1417980 RepID=UPI0012FEE58B
MSDGTQQPSRQDLDRRHFLAGAAAGAATAAVGITACDTPRGHKPDTTTTATPTAAIERERHRPGTSDWRIHATGPPDAVQGFADKVSVLPGEEFGLYVSTTAPGFRVSAYRIGWYGGAQARRVWRSDRVAGRVQRGPRLIAATRTVRADWARSLTVRTDGWPEGAYLLRLDAEHGHQRYVPLIVRSASARGRTVLMHAPATWQAYNLWGGLDLYQGEGGAYSTRSLAVSFDRPYDKNGADKFMVYERAVVVLAERLGLPLAYTTGIDVHADPSALNGATAVVALGHDEYWTPEQRRHVTRARDAGTNVAFLGANTCFRRIRLERTARTAAKTSTNMGTSTTGTTATARTNGTTATSSTTTASTANSADLRTVVCYKTDFRADPYLATHPTMATTDFRQPPGAD